MFANHSQPKIVMAPAERGKTCNRRLISSGRYLTERLKREIMYSAPNMRGKTARVKKLESFRFTNNLETLI